MADRPVGRADARIRAAAPIDEATARAVAGDLVTTTDEIGWDDGRLVARRVETLGAIVLREAPLPRPRPAAPCGRRAATGCGAAASALLTWTDAAAALRDRLAFCHAHLGAPWPAVDDDALLARSDGWLGPDLAAVRRRAATSPASTSPPPCAGCCRGRRRPGSTSSRPSG